MTTTSTLTTSEISRLLQTQPRVLRALLRSNPAGLPQHLTPVGSGGRYKFSTSDIPVLHALLHAPNHTTPSPEDLTSIALPPSITIPNPLKDKKATRTAHLEGAARARRLQEMMAVIYSNRDLPIHTS